MMSLFPGCRDEIGNEQPWMTWATESAEHADDGRQTTENGIVGWRLSPTNSQYSIANSQWQKPCFCAKIAAFQKIFTFSKKMTKQLSTFSPPQTPLFVKGRMCLFWTRVRSIIGTDSLERAIEHGVKNVISWNGRWVL